MILFLAKEMEVEVTGWSFQESSYFSDEIGQSHLAHAF